MQDLSDISYFGLLFLCPPPAFFFFFFLMFYPCSSFKADALTQLSSRQSLLGMLRMSYHPDDPRALESACWQRAGSSRLSCVVWRTFPPGDAHCQPDQTDLAKLPSSPVLAKELGQIMFQRISPKGFPWLPSLQREPGFSLLCPCFSKKE